MGKEFDAVVVCNGHYDKPYIPSICGLSGWMHKWPDRIRHSRHYQSNDAFKSKVSRKIIHRPDAGLEDS